LPQILGADVAALFQPIRIDQAQGIIVWGSKNGFDECVIVNRWLLRRIMCKLTGAAFAIRTNAPALRRENLPLSDNLTQNL
jgi:hypothetical protein